MPMLRYISAIAQITKHLLATGRLRANAKIFLIVTNPDAMESFY